MDKEGKKALEQFHRKRNEKYGVPQDVEEFAAKIADKQDNPSMHELAKEFPKKPYKELEEYRNADRHAEANQIPLTEAQRNLVEHIEAGACIMGEMRKDREDPQEKIKELEDALANSLEVNESHQRLNGKLQVRIAELEDDNKKMHDQQDKQLEAARKAGL